ncbi:alpha/beta hydrolase [Amycolatopsis pittospori]|uniref:alpha/beta hydrolase n=1 Tax=Amycolatopsis pittospori TaxID=2749434 RepID=UPI0015F0E7F5|nr:alpha/beta hydrolase [Amycolatopsis pittospori]
MALSVALVAGCATSQGSPAPPTKVDEPEHDAALAPFYRQTVNWQPCEALQCAKLTVPMDYRRPDGPKFTVPLIKAAATRPGGRLGTLVAGAGGPGQSGVAMVKDIAGTWPASVRERFDLVGFDPRGIGGSEPRLTCETEGEPTEKAPEGLPLIGAEVPRTRQYAEACLRDTGREVLPHLGTDDIVSDLDVLRVATGQEKLTYVGFSYGTRIGQLYAERFPKKIRAMVLDGVDNTYLDWRNDTVEQAKSVEETLHAYAKQCATRTDKPCPGRDETEILATVDRVLAKADKEGDGASLREAISGKLTFPADWAELSGILLGADAPADGRSDGEPSDAPEESTDTTDALTVVNCLDRPHPADLAPYEEAARELRRVSRLSSGIEALGCAFLPTATTPARTVHADGAPPILLVGTTRDAATPYDWAQHLAGSLRSAVLLSNEDIGHAVYGGTSSCVDAAVSRYLVDLTLPATPARCATGTGG